MTTRLTSRLPPRLIRRLRGAWVALALFVIITWVPRILARFSSLPPDDGLALLSRLVEVFTFTMFAAVALTLYWRRGDDWLALFTGMMLLLTAYGYTGSRLTGTYWAFASFFLVVLMEVFQVTFFYIFPDGKFLPRWAKYGVVPLFVFRFLIWENIYRNSLPQGALEVGIVVLLLLIGVGLQVYRYRSYANPTQRQQVKWLLVGFTATILFVAPSVYVVSVFTDTARELVAVVVILRTLALLLVPISLGISVMRYRLWDLDLTINRSVKGVIVGVFLAAIFAAVFLATRAGIQALFGPQSSVFALAAGVIVVGLLFNPVRDRVRHFIDTRLYDLRFDLDELRESQKPPEVKKPGTMTGQHVGEYEVLDLLGRGGMGEVYLGFGGERIVAIKIMPPEIASQGKNAQRFEREIEALKTLDHPNVVHLIDSGVDNDRRYMIMDFIDGQDLTHVLREKGMFSPEVAYDIVKQIGAALTYIHSREQIHRDVTSGNIMLSPNGERYDAVLMDFGLVKMLKTPTNITMSSDVMGTIDYMAPEQIVQTQTVDLRSDIYALGAVYYEMLTGKRPFSGGPAQVLFGHLYQPPPDPRQVRPELPRGLSHAIMRALAKSPDDRFQTVQEFVEAAGAPEVEAAAAA